jgi:hypothetical protein
MGLERYRSLRTMRIDIFRVELIHSRNDVADEAIKINILNKIDSILIEILFARELGVIYN